MTTGTALLILGSVALAAGVIAGALRPTPVIDCRRCMAECNDPWIQRSSPLLPIDEPEDAGREDSGP